MIRYTFQLNEEIARWSTEVYIRQNKELGWWIAFTNPTAGPWKKIVVQTELGESVELHRFLREDERPDLILVNDRLRLILVVEAKDTCSRLITDAQMIKSVRVINEMVSVLANSDNEHWERRKKYRVIPSFLWICGKKERILEENALVSAAMTRHATANLDRHILNIVIYKDARDALVNSFIFNGNEYDTLNAPFPAD